MKRIVNVDVMRKSDSLKIDEVGSTNLMYEAGKSIFNSYDFKDKKVGIIVGSGNNAGDGYVLASFLPNSVILKINDKFSNDGLFFFKKLNNKVINIDKNYKFNEFDCLVDSIFGTGFNKSR